MWQPAAWQGTPSRVRGFATSLFKAFKRCPRGSVQPFPAHPTTPPPVLHRPLSVLSSVLRPSTTWRSPTAPSRLLRRPRAAPPLPVSGPHWVRCAPRAASAAAEAGQLGASRSAGWAGGRCASSACICSTGAAFPCAQCSHLAASLARCFQSGAPRPAHPALRTLDRSHPPALAPLPFHPGPA